MLFCGEVTTASRDDAFGNITEQTGTANNSINYAGYQYDKETGLYYLNARHYDPVTARFLQEDTYRGQANDPLSLNLYVYCHNEPLMYVDPTGHWASEAERQNAYNTYSNVDYDNMAKLGEEWNRLNKLANDKNSSSMDTRLYLEARDKQKDLADSIRKKYSNVSTGNGDSNEDKPLWKKNV